MGTKSKLKSLNLDKLQQKSIDDGYKCVVGGLVVREFEDGQAALYVQKRSANRSLFPDCWDILGGHVDDGETLEEALAREIKEESGWELESIVKHLKTVTWQNTSGETVQEFVFLITVNGNLDQPRLETEKFSEYRWVQKNELEILKENRALGEQLIYELATLAFKESA